MQYLSFSFLFFVAFIWGIYYFMPQAHRWKILLCASVLFYLAFDIKYIFFLFFVALSTFITARIISKNKSKKVFIIGVLLNILLWFVIKVLPWCGTILNTIIGKLFDGSSITLPSFIVPVGISYYVLMALSYLIDVYKGKIEKEDNFAKYLLYLTYFPTIVQGPISKYDALRSQLCAGTRIHFDQFRQSLLLIMIGLIKKMVIADRVAILANHCFENYADLTGMVLYAGAVCYSIQLYMDFSGCVDICRGVSALFGIDLVDNFNAPYFARSIKEFWAKWHISLSTWLKDYVYIPLGGNRKGKMRKYLNLLLTFFVSGIWHGAGINFIFWGLLQGIYQIIGEVTTDLRAKIRDWLQIAPGSKSEKIYQTIITFNLTTLAWIFFRSGRFLSGVEYVGNMLHFTGLGDLLEGSIFITGFSFAQVIVLVINIAFISILDYLKSKKNIDVKQKILSSHILLRWAIYFLLVYDVILFGVYGAGYDTSGFLYGGF